MSILLTGAVIFAISHFCKPVGRVIAIVSFIPLFVVFLVAEQYLLTHQRWTPQLME